MLVLVGLGILMLSWINFINLSIAQSLNRFGEVVIKKALGSSNRQLIEQFVFESLLINAVQPCYSPFCFCCCRIAISKNLQEAIFYPYLTIAFILIRYSFVSFVVGSILTSAYPSLFLVS